MGGVCGACSDRVSTRYDQGRCDVVLRKFVGYTPIAFHCSLSFTDILDTATDGEWDTALGNGDILVFPTTGTLELGTPTNTPVGQDACGNDIPGTDNYPWTYTNPDVDEDYDDEDFYYELGKSFNSYKFGFIRQCDGEETRIYLNDPTVAAIKAGSSPVATLNPGHQFGLTTRPNWVGVNGRGEAGQWSMGGTLRTNTVLRSVPIPGLAALLLNY